MKIGILKHTNTVFKSPIRFLYRISDGKQETEIFSADDCEEGSTVSEITDGTFEPLKTYGGEIKILKKWELYDEVDLDSSINFELLEKSMKKLPITAEFFVDLIKAIKETRESQTRILSFLKNKYRFISK